VRFLAVGYGLNKTPDGGPGVIGALPRRWLRVKQDGGCGLNNTPDGGPGVIGALPRRWLRVKQDA
jgi:hypothetical protein